MRFILKLVFIFFFIAIAYGTVTATLDRGMVTALRELWPDAWFRASLIDTYCAFLTIYLWIAYKEKSFFARALWLVLVLVLGTLAYSVYILIQLFKLKPEEPLSHLLLRCPTLSSPVLRGRDREGGP